MRAYELTDIAGLIKKTEALLHCPLTHRRASPLWRSVRLWLTGLTVWVDSSLAMTWSLVEAARPIRKHVRVCVCVC